MKIMFDSEGQKNVFLSDLGCPGILGFSDLPKGECNPYLHEVCVRCWEQSGVEIVVKGGGSDDES